jgi:hypothetical protein
MKVCYAVCCLLGMACSAQPKDDAEIKQIVKTKVIELNDAVMKEDHGKVVDLTHPKVVKLSGGRDKMISAMTAGNKQMKAQGSAFHSCKVAEPTDLVSEGSELYVVVPFLLEMKVPDGKLLVQSFVIGISTDKGKSWTFVNGDIDRQKVKEVLPNLPDKLTLPEKKKPVFEKD